MRFFFTVMSAVIIPVAILASAQEKLSSAIGHAVVFTYPRFVNARVTPMLRLIRTLFLSLTLRVSFIPTYYRRSELIWLDGFLFDFLQKKSVDIWLRKFVINTGYLFSERMVFDQVVRVYLDNIIWPLHYIGALETDNVSEMLSIIIFLYFFFIAILSLIFIIF